MSEENSELDDYHWKPKGIPDKTQIKSKKRSLDYIMGLPISNCFDVNEGKVQTNSLKTKGLQRGYVV